MGTSHARWKWDERACRTGRPARMTPDACGSQTPCACAVFLILQRPSIRHAHHEGCIGTGGWYRRVYGTMGAGTKQGDARESWLPASANLRSFKGSVSRPYPTNEDVPDRYKPIVRPPSPSSSSPAVRLPRRGRTSNQSIREGTMAVLHTHARGPATRGMHAGRYQCVDRQPSYDSGSWCRLRAEAACRVAK